MCVLLWDRVFVLFDGSDVVEDPETAPMSGDDEISVLDDEVVDRRHRQIQLHGLPLRTVIERNVHALFGAGEEKVRTSRIDAHGVDVVVGGNASDELRPSFSEVGGLENVWSEVVGLVAFDGHVCRSSIAGRGFDHANRAPFGHGFGRDIFPVLAAVASDVDEAVIGAGPDQIFLHRRFDDRKNCVVNFDARIVFGDRPTRCRLFGFVIAREVRTDNRPTHPGVGGLEEDFTRVVERLRIVGREDNRLGPLKAMFDVGGGPSDGIDGPGIDRLFLMDVAILARNLATIGSGVNDERVSWIGRNVTALAATDVVPVRTIDRSVGTGTGDGDGGVVLLRAVDVVGEAVVGGDVVELRGRLVVLSGPALAAVGGDGCAAVVAVDHALGIGGIDPEAVVVAMRSADRRESLATDRHQY